MGLVLNACFTSFSTNTSPLTFFVHFYILSYFILAVPMRDCLEKHSCVCSSFPIAILKKHFPIAILKYNFI